MAPSIGSLTGLIIKWFKSHVVAFTVTQVTVKAVTCMPFIVKPFSDPLILEEIRTIRTSYTPCWSGPKPCQQNVPSH